jgi:hypothetical protein
MKLTSLAVVATALLAIIAAPADAKPRKHKSHHHHVSKKKVTAAPSPRPRFPICLMKPKDWPSKVAQVALLDEMPRVLMMPAPFVIDSPETAARIEEARRYIVKTTLAEGPGGTMLSTGRRIVAKMPASERARLSAADIRRIGVEANVGRLHPIFAMRLALAIEAARNTVCTVQKRIRRKLVTVTSRCLSNVALFSGYRDPGLGVGGFGDKYQSSHAYGVGGDMRGIGRPGSRETRLWQKIAWQYRIYSPYGPQNRAEWNHVQATGIKMVLREVPALRHTITRDGPIDLTRMWAIAARVIDKGQNWLEASARARAPRVHGRAHVRRKARAGSRWVRRHPPRPQLAQPSFWTPYAGA